MLLALSANVPARAADAVAGHYRLVDGPDSAAELVVRENGTFEYGLEEGALDEHAEGRWSRKDNALVLTTIPTPVPPLFRMAARSAPAPEAPTLRVTSPDGQGIGGVDFRIGFDAGDPVQGYTQQSGWTMPGDEHRSPRWIELAEPVYRFVSPRYPIADGAGTLNFVIVPNDIGTVDFGGVKIDILADGLLVHRGERDMKFVREPAGG